jgi:hypothetical protein
LTHSICHAFIRCMICIKDHQMHCNFTDVFYYIMVTNMFQPVMWPSSGWFLWEQEHNYNYNTSEIPQSKKKHIISGKNSLLNDKINYEWWLQEHQKLKLSGVCRLMYFWFNWHILYNRWYCLFSAVFLLYSCGQM